MPPATIDDSLNKYIYQHTTLGLESPKTPLLLTSSIVSLIAHYQHEMKEDEQGLTISCFALGPGLIRNEHKKNPDLDDFDINRPLTKIGIYIHEDVLKSTEMPSNWAGKESPTLKNVITYLSKHYTK